MASRYLNNITINDAYTLPSTDGTNGQGIVTDGAGNLSFQDLASTTATSALSIVLTVKNVSGGSLSPGTLVRVAPTATPPSGNVLEVDIADNSSASTMPAIGIITDTIADQAEGDCVAFGRASGFSTSGYTEGDPIWVGTSGAFTGTKPTGTALIQKVGQIIKVHASNGSIEVFGAGRSNDVPNIPQDQLWLGNSSGVATPTAHTVENISNVTVSSKQNGQALVWDAANNYWKNGTVSGGGGGGGGTELSIERDVFTATANQTAFTISSDITASSNTQVYIDGVYQAKGNYTTSGSTITFSTGVPAGSEVEVIHFISVLSKVYTDTFTGNGTTVDFTASKDVTDENVTQVYIDGVYQSKDNYTTSGTTITFSTAPPSGSAIEVVHFTPAVYSTLNSNQFTGTGSQTDFTLTQAVEEDKSFVFIQGIYQEKSTYSISDTTLTFTTAPQSGYTVEVITVGEVSMLPDTVGIDNFSGTGSQVDFVLTSTPSTENAIDVYINGLYQQKDTFSLSGSTLTFSTAPPNGSTIEVKHQFVASVKGEVTLTAGTGISVTKNSNNNFTISNTLIDVLVSYNTPTGQGFTYTTPNSSTGQAGSIYAPQTFTVTDGTSILSGTATVSGLPDGIIVSSQSYNNTNSGNVLTITLAGVFPSANNLNTNLTISGLTATIPLEVDYLVVAGGGSGGRAAGGGGGAGGLRTSYGSSSGGGSSAESSLILDASTNYTVTVGAGGPGVTVDGTNGSDSVFGAITSDGGGAGGITVTPGTSGGAVGGSGGGGRGAGGSGTGASGTPNQGYAGGNAQTGSPYHGGGGGGAGAVGANANGNSGGNGGDGLAVSISGSSVTYAGGGGGGCYTSGTPGSGGAGGGGIGDATSGGSGGDGAANTGGGSGGGWQSSNGSSSSRGGNGGSGVVILRYPSGYTITIGAGLTGTTATDGSDKVTTFTAGTGNISFS